MMLASIREFLFGPHADQFQHDPLALIGWHIAVFLAFACGISVALFIRNRK